MNTNTNLNNKRLYNYPSDNLCKRRRVSPLSINTVSTNKRNNYPVYVQQQPVMVTNYYKPQVSANTQNKIMVQPQPSKQNQSTSEEFSNQFKVTQVSEVFQGCSELSLPKLVIYLIYKIWCCCNLSQYQHLEPPMSHTNGYISPKITPINSIPSSTSAGLKYPLFPSQINYARIPSPVTPLDNQFSNEKVNALYQNICQSKIFQSQPTPMNKRTTDSDEEDKTAQSHVDPKDLETQILKACSRSCTGELKNNYSKLINYVDHLLKITQISFSSVILALEYIYRLKEASQTPEGKFLNQWSYEEIIPIAFMMANKFISDDRYSNTVWANVTNIPLNHLNHLEMKALVAISFRLYISESDYNGWINLIKKVSRDLTFKYEQLKKPIQAQNKPISVITYNLSNIFTPTTTASPKPSHPNHLTTPSSHLNTAVYSPMTPSKIQYVKKMPSSNLYITRGSKSQMVNMIPKPQQLLPNLPVTRVIKPQSHPTMITIPAPYQNNGFNPKLNNMYFFPKLNNTQITKVPVQLQTPTKSIPIVRQNVIYPSPPLSRTCSPTPAEIFERYLIQKKNTITPQYIKTQPIVNPFIKGFAMNN